MTFGVLAANSSSSSVNTTSSLGCSASSSWPGLGVGAVFLLRSMNKQFRKITPEPGPSLPDDENAEGRRVTDS